MIDFKRFATETPAECEFTFDGVTIPAWRGDSVLSALLASRQANTILATSLSFRPWCLMGTCYGCQVMLNGRMVQACMTPASEALVILSVASADNTELSAGQNEA